MCQAEQDFCSKFFGLGSDTDFIVSDVFFHVKSNGVGRG